MQPDMLLCLTAQCLTTLSLHCMSLRPQHCKHYDFDDLHAHARLYLHAQVLMQASSKPEAAAAAGGSPSSKAGTGSRSSPAEAHHRCPCSNLHQLVHECYMYTKCFAVPAWLSSDWRPWHTWQPRTHMWCVALASAREAGRSRLAKVLSCSAGQYCIVLSYYMG